MSTKILFCRHNNVLFWKRKDTFKTQNIDKISLQKGLTVCEKPAVKRVRWHAWRSARHCLPGQSDDPSRNLKFAFWSEHHCFYFLTVVLSTIVTVGMKFDPTCRQRNLSSTTARVQMIICIVAYSSSVVIFLRSLHYFLFTSPCLFILHRPPLDYSGAEALSLLQTPPVKRVRHG